MASVDKQYKKHEKNVLSSSVGKSGNESQRSGKYIKIGAVLGNVNIIHQTKVSDTQKQKSLDRSSKDE